MELKDFLIRGLRALSYKWQARSEAKKKARVSRGIYECASCKDNWRNKDICLDHIDPVIDPVEGFKDWNEYIRRLFCDAEGFQVLCRDCHLKKSRAENEIRKKHRSKE